MKRTVIPLLLCFFWFQPCLSKVFGKCELATHLETKFNFTKDEVKNWVCVAEFESTFNSTAINHFNWDGSQDYGLFQINNNFWCGDDFGQNVCRIPCTDLLDDDLTDDIKCVKRIKRDTERWTKTKNGFVAWVAYVNRCQTRDLDEYISECWSTTTTTTTTTSPATTTTTTTAKPSSEEATIKPTAFQEEPIDTVPTRASSLGTVSVKITPSQISANKLGSESPASLGHTAISSSLPIRASGSGLVLDTEPQLGLLALGTLNKPDIMKPVSVTSDTSTLIASGVGQQLPTRASGAGNNADSLHSNLKTTPDNLSKTPGSPSSPLKLFNIESSDSFKPPRASAVGLVSDISQDGLSAFDWPIKPISDIVTIVSGVEVEKPHTTFDTGLSTNNEQPIGMAPTLQSGLKTVSASIHSDLFEPLRPSGVWLNPQESSKESLHTLDKPIKFSSSHPLYIVPNSDTLTASDIEQEPQPEAFGTKLSTNNDLPISLLTSIVHSPIKITSDASLTLPDYVLKPLIGIDKKYTDLFDITKAEGAGISHQYEQQEDFPFGILSGPDENADHSAKPVIALPDTMLNKPSLLIPPQNSGEGLGLHAAGFLMGKPNGVTSFSFVPNINSLIAFGMKQVDPAELAPYKDSEAAFFANQQAEPSVLPPGIPNKMIAMVDGIPTLVMSTDALDINNAEKPILLFPAEAEDGGFASIQKYPSILNSLVFPQGFSSGFGITPNFQPMFGQNPSSKDKIFPYIPMDKLNQLPLLNGLKYGNYPFPQKMDPSNQNSFIPIIFNQSPNFPSSYAHNNNPYNGYYNSYQSYYPYK